MNPTGLYFLIFFIWTTGLLVFITMQTKDKDRPVAPTIQYEITETQKQAQQNLEQKLQELEQKQKDIDAELEKAQSRYSQLKLEAENSGKKKRKT
ncbi:MAG: hypothetical protein J6A01_08600 [Proteobacteria bacterium]|nr:hypothetical protein [Pseudomonadota bacterium]